MLFYIIALIFATSSLVVAVLIGLSGDLNVFKRKYGPRPLKECDIPIISSNGQILSTVEDLEEQLGYLKNQLDEKQKEIEKTKFKVSSASDSLKKLGETSNEVKKYYTKLKSDIGKSEDECKQLQNQILAYREKQKKLREEVKENVKYYSNILSNLDVKSMNLEGFELPE